MISFQAHGDHHWYQSLTATAAASSLNPLGTVPLRDEHGKASFPRTESPFNGTAAQQATAAQPAGYAKGFPRGSAPAMDPQPFPQHHVSMHPKPLPRQHGPQEQPCMFPCSPEGRILPLHPAEPRAAQPGGSCRETLLSPILGGSWQRSSWGAEPRSPLPPEERGCSSPAAHRGRRHIHPLLSAGAGADQDLSAQGSRSSPSAQLFQETSMAVTLSERVYNPAAALGSLSRAGGRLGSRGCRSSGARCCQRSDARVSHTLQYPRGCPDHRHVHPYG